MVWAVSVTSAAAAAAAGGKVAGIWRFLGGRAGKEGKFPFFSVGGVTDCKSRFDVNQLIR